MRLLMLLVLATGCVSGMQVPPTSLDIQGHRGARGLLPENSIAAFTKALDLGVTTLELDLQVTKDRILIVDHDPFPNAKRCQTTDGSPFPTQLFRDLPYETVLTLDCGSIQNPRFPEQRTVPGSKIPTLDQVFAVVQNATYPVKMNIEMKMENPEKTVSAEEFATLLVRAIRRHRFESRVTLQSFYPPALRKASEIAPEIPRAVLVEKPSDYDAHVQASHATILSPDYEYLRKSDVLRFQKAGIKVVPWTVNNVKDMERLIYWQVDGLISDYPNRLLDTWKKVSVNSDRKG